MTVSPGPPGPGGGAAGAGPTPAPALALLRGGLLPTLGTGGLLVVIVALSTDGRAAVGAALGAGLACLAMSAGPLLMHATRRWSPPAVMAVALLAYGLVVIVLGLIYLTLEQVAWLSAGHLGVALAVCCAAWTVGQLWAARRLRVLAFAGAGAGTDAA
jgi:hypothetical protein